VLRDRARLPVLADPSFGMIVIHAPERLTPALQRRLARAIGDGMFRVAGSRRSLPVKPRIVLLCHAAAGSEKAGESLLAAGLEEELQARLKGWSLRLPPLRECLQDLEQIIALQTADASENENEQNIFSPAAIQKLHAHSWPGNDAELREVLGILACRA